MRTAPQILVMLLIYDYDAYPRSRFIEHEVKSFEDATVLKARLTKLAGDIPAKGRTARWLDRHHGVSGFVQRVDWIYERKLTRLDG
jgi:hypothetical protein